MSSSPFPILDNRPIDKWKVTELKEELKRRRLTTRGLKEELVRRLDEALRLEQEESERINSAAVAAAEKANQEAQMFSFTGGNITPDRKQTTPVAPFAAAFSNETTPVTAEKPPEPTETKTTTEASAAVETTPPPVFSEPEVNTVQFASHEDEKVDDVRGDIAGLGSSASEHIIHNSQPFSGDIAGLGSSASDPFSGLDGGGSKAQPTEAVLENSAMYNQVSEVIPVTGFEVKSDCISTDSVSNNEKIELKDNKIADNVKLEQNVNKSQEPSKVAAELHPMDVEAPLEQKISVGGGDDSNAANTDMTKDNNIIDAGDSEKLNLDRSSGDESMEDEPETKQTESVTSDDKSEKIEMLSKEETRADMDAGKGKATENKNHPLVASDKRKLPANDQEAVGNNEPAKRRRWNSESIKIPEAQANNSAAPTTTPRSTGLKRDFSRSDSSVSEDGPKERVVPPSPKEPTNSLRIDRFLRPFTLKAVQELLGKTGNVTSFWMDHIKTHCYVTYSSVEEAAATRQAVYNLQWPPNGGRFLTAEFVGPEEVKAKLEAPLPPPPQPQHQTQAQAASRPPPTALPPPPPPLTKPPPVAERLPPPPALAPEEQEPPIVTLDDLFKKTKAIPRIYYLPLSEEQVAAKLAAKNNK
ncbi:hypothetical protein CARUB_v10004348mg [Capsella rubella]|uniref:SAP domain-containing protein n=1 Tax=Capsella rubella TaxID=81985 RepID=R0GW00_9BRAS|nr:apoptotic chromatin condensation inducer in the nucleus [Capsella rubella]XP_023634030.1 apoptotic chromatin condensation inducer in the nucleus [Capsella rubella]EOA15353.1 hypothetical protein CARUB_v10004348mg [Capsella rubella]